ncbi:AzlC family ABC transporter permease [Sporolactobacillus spathodeae]|uniref:4-azaleucine resistance transporter AzlC n=1 Tax=Sporolactobacillus spathodeae TaxID=1465502 RepID=A0ABS2Q7B8_9BACL|nr:AzlC family ABC transporter permease [Sporolactobacillus spathodeae]MBM7657670.1 4-azaleucine resistance transporter AzlC [Sporolactobacillus spathodeae]
MTRDERIRTIRTAFTEATPLVLAVATYGLSYGVLATQAGFNRAETVGMSLFVFSGTIQMVAVAMIMTGASIASIFVTSILLNLRNLLYGAALSSGLGTNRKLRWLLAPGISDEPFVLATAYFKKNGPSPLYYSVLTLMFYSAWVISSLIGALAGNQINPQTWGLDLTFPVTFIALLVPSLKGRPALATALAAVGIAFGIELLFPGNDFTIIITGAVAPFVGLFLARRKAHA